MASLLHQTLSHKNKNLEMTTKTKVIDKLAPANCFVHISIKNVEIHQLDSMNE